MEKSNIDRALAVLEGIGARDADLATRYVHPERYVEHDPRRADGADGLREWVRGLSPGSHLTVLRVLEDGSSIFTQAEGLVDGRGVFFDVFRFEDGLIVEHWGYAAEAAPPNGSGHTQSDGPREPDLSRDAEKNKALVRDYYETVHISGDHDKIPQYVSTDQCTRHEPGVRDGLMAFIGDLKAAVTHRTIDEIRLLLGQGDFVFLVARGTHDGLPCGYIDLYRVADAKIVEHWGFFAEAPPRKDWKNGNGML